MLLVLCNQTEEYGQAGSRERDPPQPIGECHGTRESLPEQSHRCAPNTSGRSGRSSRSRAGVGTLRCSIRRLTASFVAVMSSRSGSRISLPVDTPRIAQRFDKRRPVGCDLAGAIPSCKAIVADLVAKASRAPASAWRRRSPPTTRVGKISPSCRTRNGPRFSGTCRGKTLNATNPKGKSMTRASESSI
jgi:hypothetical protein